MDRKTNGVQQYYQEIRNRLKNYIKSDYLANSETLLLYAEDILGNDCNDDINIAKEPYIETSSSCLITKRMLCFINFVAMVQSHIHC